MPTDSNSTQTSNNKLGIGFLLFGIGITCIGAGLIPVSELFVPTWVLYAIAGIFYLNGVRFMLTEGATKWYHSVCSKISSLLAIIALYGVGTYATGGCRAGGSKVLLDNASLLCLLPAHVAMVWAFGFTVMQIKAVYRLVTSK